MKFKIDGWNNLHRVFRLPTKFSSEFCFGGGIPQTIVMVDWYNTITDLPLPGVSKEVWREKVGPIAVKELTLQEIYDRLVPFIRKKTYCMPGGKYLVICNCGASFTFEAEDR